MFPHLSSIELICASTLCNDNQLVQLREPWKAKASSRKHCFVGVELGSRNRLKKSKKVSDVRYAFKTFEQLQNSLKVALKRTFSEQQLARGSSAEHDVACV